MISSTLPDTLGWPDATIVRGDAVAIVSRLITGRSGTSPVLRGADDLNLQLLESRTLDGHTQELTYHPTRQ